MGDQEERKCTFDWASAIAAMMIPVVSIATLKTGLRLGRLAECFSAEEKIAHPGLSYIVFPIYIQQA